MLNIGYARVYCLCRYYVAADESLLLLKDTCLRLAPPDSVRQARYCHCARARRRRSIFALCRLSPLFRRLCHAAYAPPRAYYAIFMLPLTLDFFRCRR